MPEGAATGNIFISYRREDSAAYAGRICDHLSAVFGGDRVFMDVDDIGPGQRFPQTIDRTLESCDVALVIIGPRWAEILRQRSREEQPDYVRREIEAALSREIPIVPVLVGGANIAQVADLPGTLAALRSYQAAELRDATFKEDCARLAKSLGIPPAARVQSAEAGRKKGLLYAAAAAAVVAALLLAFGIGPWRDYQARKSTLNQLFATARSQADRDEYESAFKTSQELLKADPGHGAALDLQVDIAMGWLRDFRVIAPEGRKSEDIAGPRLAELMAVLDAGLARTNGHESRSADILAHSGWAHWLNQRLAFKEFGPAAERDFRQALKIDPSNVYANAMLGNWLLQTNGSLAEAKRHLATAVQSGKLRPFVRDFQLGGLISNNEPGIRSELVRVANEMRKSREPIHEPYTRRILSNYSPSMNSIEELKETLSAVPPADAWATFLWLDPRQPEGRASSDQRFRHDFIHAGILELEGKRPEAREAFGKLKVDVERQGYSSRIVSHVTSAIKRLSQ